MVLLAHQRTVSVQGKTHTVYVPKDMVEKVPTMAGFTPNVLFCHEKPEKGEPRQHVKTLPKPRPTRTPDTCGDSSPLDGWGGAGLSWAGPLQSANQTV